LARLDFGIIIDGTIVMVENIYRELAERKGQTYQLHDVIISAARDVDRPIFYSVAVIYRGVSADLRSERSCREALHTPWRTPWPSHWPAALLFTLTLVPGPGFLRLQEGRPGEDEPGL